MFTNFLYIECMKYLKNRSHYILENMDQAKSIFKKKSEDFEKLKVLLSKNLGYMGKFTEYLLNENIPYNELEDLFSKLLNLSKRQSSIDINKLSYEKVLDKVQLESENLKIKDLINQFPAEQKAYAKEIIDDGYRRVLLSVSNLDHVKNLISKISRYKSSESLLSALKIFAKSSVKNDKDSVKKSLQNLSSEIVFENDNLLIIRVDKYEDIKILGSDTSWCIVPSESTFNRYVKGRIQYIIYDYSKDELHSESKIGVTLEKSGIIHACHDILDNSVKSRFREILEENNLNVKDILPKIDKSKIMDLSKINKKTDFDLIKSQIHELDNEEIKKIIIKVCELGSISNGSANSSRRKLLEMCYTIIFGERDYVLEKELSDISPNFRFLIYRDKTKNLVRIDEVDSNLIKSAFVKGLEIWKDNLYFKIDMDSILRIKEYGMEVLKLVSDKLNSLYKSDKYPKYKKSVSRLGWGYFELSMLLCNKILKRENIISNFESMVNDLSDIIDNNIELVKIFDIKINLKNLYENDIDIIEYIDKKDYDGVRIRRPRLGGSSGIDFYEKVIDHLKGHKVGFVITKDTIFEFTIRLDPKYKDSILMNLIIELSKMKRPKGKSLTNGNITITVD